MHRRADQQRKRAGVYAGIGIEGNDIACAGQGSFVPGDGKLAVLPAEELCKLDERAALSLMPAVALTVIASPAGEEVEAAAVFFVQRINGALRIAQQLRIARRFGGRCSGQVGKQAEAEVLSLAAAGKTQSLKALRIAAAEDDGDDADALPLIGHTLAQVETRHGAGAHNAHEEKIHRGLHKLRHRQEQQRRKPKAAEGKGNTETDK